MMTAVLIFLCFCYVFSDINLLTNWTLIEAPIFLNGRNQLGIGYLSSTNMIYIFGGYANDIIGTFDPDNDQYQTIGTLPVRTYFESQGYTQINNIIYFERDSNLYTLHMNNLTILSINSINNQHIPCLTSDNEYIYITGGTDSSTELPDGGGGYYLNPSTTILNKFIYFDIIEQSFKNGPNLFKKLVRHSCGYMYNGIYLFGGKSATLSNTIQYMNTTNINLLPNWIELNINLPGNYDSSCCVIVYDLFYIIGGVNSGTFADISKNVIVFNPKTNTIQLDNQLNIVRESPAAIFVNNYLYTFGGMTTGSPVRHYTQSWEKSNYFNTNTPTILTKIPSIIPTINPTTKNPTKIPTILPTLNPTTNNPTIIPTNVPTLIPTNIPTHIPTNIPTILPTNYPTLIPTNIPSQNPTKMETTTFENTVVQLNNKKSNILLTLLIISVIIIILLLICGMFGYLYLQNKKMKTQLTTIQKSTNFDDITSQKMRSVSSITIIDESKNDTVGNTDGEYLNTNTGAEGETINITMNNNDTKTIDYVMNDEYFNSLKNDHIIAKEVDANTHDVYSFTKGYIGKNEFNTPGNQYNTQLQSSTVSNDSIIAENIQQNMNDVHGFTKGNIQVNQWVTKQ